MCVPPVGCIIPAASPAFAYHAEIYETFCDAAHRLGARYPLPCSFMRQMHTTLDLEDFGGKFMLTSLTTTVNSCCPDREVPTVGPEQVLFDVTVKLGERYYHLTCVARCHVLHPYTDIISFFKPTPLPYV